MPVATRPDKPLTLIGPAAGGSSPSPEPRHEPGSRGAEPSAGPASPAEPAGEEHHAERDDYGRASRAEPAGAEHHAERDDYSPAAPARRAGAEHHAERDDYGRASRAEPTGEEHHAERDDYGRTSPAEPAGEAHHAERDDYGRASRAESAGEAHHAERDNYSPASRAELAGAEHHAERDDYGPAAPVSEEEEVLRQIRNLPPELAVLLLSVGTLGFLLPGIIGTPALIAGGLALWPKAFGRAESWFEKRYPSVHRQSLHQMGRFLADLDRRYPQLPIA